MLVNKIAPHVYQHISYLNAGSFGLVPCNGLVIINKNEAIIFDTPTGIDASNELISWVENGLHCKIKAIIPTHFHADCLAGLDAFHKKNIPSYANDSTISLAKAFNKTVPMNGFSNSLELKVGNQMVIAEFHGEGHTKDNIVGYFPYDEVLFGGCLVKEKGAGKGNLEDANIVDWAHTVSKIKEKYKNLKVVVPGHGKSGGSELLDYTIDLFTFN
ncbi:metallo-beta-lactamase class B [Saonia flava]|uniref:beta-lactamase n=1 Tax=Saonia flava TaxID=523696 RepID=A0A846R3D4_9FLAO|nr:metallo-beta-lactamase class B [Saonia flava]